MITLLESTLAQITYSIFILVLLGAVLRSAFKRFTSLELPPKTFPFVPEKNRSFGKSITTVKVGLSINNFTNFNIQEASFSLDGTIWFEFSPSQVSLEDLSKFEFFQGTIADKSVAEIKQLEGKIFAAYNFKVSFSSPLNYKLFPFADHRVFLILKNNALSAKELQFSPPEGGLTVPEGLSLSGWKLEKVRVQTGAIKDILSISDSKKTTFFPVAVFEFYFAKPGLREILLTLVPIVLLFYLSLFSLVFDFSIASKQIVQVVSLTSISGLLIQRIAVEAISPKVGHSTTSVYIHALFLFLVFSIFTIHTYYVGTPNIKVINNYVFYNFQCLMLISVWLIIKMQERKLWKVRGRFSFSIPHLGFHKNRLLSLDDYKKSSAELDEFPQQFSANPLLPDYSEYFTERIRKEFNSPLVKFGKKLGLSIDGFSPFYFKHILEEVLTTRELQKVSSQHVLLYSLKKGDRFYIWGDLQGAFHSLVRSLSYLNEQGIINDKLEIILPNHYFIFDGNVIGRSAYNLETLSLVMTLMKQNPQKVVYLKGPHEATDFWINLGLRQELEVISKDLSFKRTSLDSSLSDFFDTLPLSLYLCEMDKEEFHCVTLSSHSPALIDVTTLSYSYHNMQPGDFEMLQMSDHQPKNASSHILARIMGLEEEKNYKQPMGLDLLLPVDGATQWSIFSSPVAAHREYYNFVLDSFAVLEISSHLSTSVLKSVTQNPEFKGGFHEENYDLLTGRPTDDSLDREELFVKANEIRIGSTLDLTETASVLGERLQRGLDLCVRKMNRTGGINHGYVRVFFANDKYTPSLALQNVQKFISENKIWLILSPLGTLTTSSLIPLSEENEILILFPYTGAELFRNPKLKNILNYRASYVDEARALVHYAKNALFKKRFAFFYQDDDYGFSSLQAAKEILFRDNPVAEDAICEVSYQRNTIIVDQAVEIIEKHNPDVIFLFSTYAPSRTLVEKLGVQRLSDVTLMGVSFLTDQFRDFASGTGDLEQQGKGLTFIISRVVPNPYDSSIEIVKEYQMEMQQEYPDIRFDVDSLEGYINTSLLFDVLERIDCPYTPQKITHEFEKMKNRDFKGLKLHFDPKTRSLSKNVWLDLGGGNWILSEQHSLKRKSQNK